MFSNSTENIVKLNVSMDEEYQMFQSVNKYNLRLK